MCSVSSLSYLGVYTWPAQEWHVDTRTALTIQNTPFSSYNIPHCSAVIWSAAEELFTLSWTTRVLHFCPHVNHWGLFCPGPLPVSVRGTFFHISHQLFHIGEHQSCYGYQFWFNSFLLQRHIHTGFYLNSAICNVYVFTIFLRKRATNRKPIMADAPHDLLFVIIFA